MNQQFDEPVTSSSEAQSKPNDIELPKSGLYVRDGFLVKRDSAGKTISRHEIGTITNAVVTWRVDPSGAFFALLFTGLAVISKIYIASMFWNWAATIGFGTLALFGIFGIRQHRLLLTLSNGKVEYVVNDDPSDGQGFVLSLLSMVENDRRASH